MKEETINCAGNTQYDNCAFPIQAYGKTELAKEYLPNANTENARKEFRRWIQHNPELEKRLNEVQVNKKLHRYTQRQVRIIVDYFGEP